MKGGTRRENARTTKFGQRLRKIRESAGIDPYELSKTIGKSRTVVHQLEVGLIKSPSAKLALDLAEALGTTAEYLVNGEGEQPKPETVKRAYKRASEE